MRPVLFHTCQRSHCNNDYWIKLQPAARQINVVHWVPLTEPWPRAIMDRRASQKFLNLLKIWDYVQPFLSTRGVILTPQPAHGIHYPIFGALTIKSSKTGPVRFATCLPTASLPRVTTPKDVHKPILLSAHGVSTQGNNTEGRAQAHTSVWRSEPPPVPQQRVKYHIFSVTITSISN
jgi:hypothetical protein